MFQRHLSLSLPNPSFNESIQDFVIESSISSNTFIQLDFPSSDSLGKLKKSSKVFATSDMDDCEDISYGNCIYFDESTKRNYHRSGNRKSQTAPTKISPLRPFPEASKHLSSLFDCLDIDKGNPLHLS